MFKFFSNNRRVDTSHVNALIKSISKKNLLHLFPIIINNRNQVIDGQHRLKAAEALNKPIYYIEEDTDSGIEEVTLINVTSKKWTLMDFVEKFITQYNEGDKKYEDYVYLKEFSFKNSLSIGIAASLLSNIKGFTHTQSRNLTFLRKVKEGEFTIESGKEAIEVVRTMQALIPMIDKNIFGNREFVYALNNLLKRGYSYKTIKDSLLKSGKIIRKFSSVGEYLNEFKEITNGELDGVIES